MQIVTIRTTDTIGKFLVFIDITRFLATLPHPKNFTRADYLRFYGPPKADTAQWKAKFTLMTEVDIINFYFTKLCPLENITTEIKLEQ